MQKSITIFLPIVVIGLLIAAGLRNSKPADAAQLQRTPKTKAMKTLHDFTVKDINGNDFHLSSLKGKKVLVVNTASECGLTPQYAQLQELYDNYGGDRFEIIGFPSNDFAGQEPGSEAQIAAFCEKNYGVTFPMMAKVSVKGADMNPLYRWLTSESENGVSDYEVQWNFHKFLVDEKGNLVRDLSPQTLPLDEAVLTWVDAK